MGEYRNAKHVQYVDCGFTIVSNGGIDGSSVESNTMTPSSTSNPFKSLESGPKHIGISQVLFVVLLFVFFTIPAMAVRVGDQHVNSVKPRYAVEDLSKVYGDRLVQRKVDLRKFKTIDELFKGYMSNWTENIGGKINLAIENKNLVGKVSSSRGRQCWLQPRCLEVSG